MGVTGAVAPGPAGNRRVAWPIAQWPLRDREAWARAQRPGDFLETAGAAADWRPATIKAAVGAYGRWLAYLDDHHLLEADEPPDARMTEQTVRAYIDYLRASCASTTVASYLGILGMMIQAMVPVNDWRWLSRAQSRLQRQAKPSRNKRARIVPVEDLLQLGLDLMVQAELGAPLTPLAAALQYRDGFMIALLALRPLRRKNFLAIELGRNMLAVGTGYVLSFVEAETKTKTALEIPFPETLVPALARYLDHHRPYLLGLRDARGGDRKSAPPGDRLWINQYGQPLSDKTSLASLKKYMIARFGHDVNIHLFRDCAATSVANNDPAHARISARLLGHSNFQSTERSYILADARVAATGYHNAIASIRTQTLGGKSRGAARLVTTRRPDIRHDFHKSIPIFRRKD